MRKVLAGAALMLPAVFLNQVAAFLGLEWGIGLAALAAAIGYGLFITSQPVRGIWIWVNAAGWRRKMGTVLLAGLVTGGAGSALAALFIWTSNKNAATNAARGHPAQPLQAQQNLGRTPPPGPASQEHAQALIAQMKDAQAGSKVHPREKLMAKKEPPTVTVHGPVQGPLVISQNQSGGQTAATINNFGPPKRTLAIETRAAMIAALRSAPPAVVGIASTQGDSEASDFKSLLANVFKEAGWTVVDAGWFMFFGDHKGLMLTVAPDAALDHPAAVALVNALGLIERPVTYNRGVRPDGCEFWIQVWRAP